MAHSDQKIRSEFSCIDSDAAAVVVIGGMIRIVLIFFVVLVFLVMPERA